MKKIITLLSLAFLLLGAHIAHAEDSYLSKLDGNSWQSSTPQEKLAFVVGMDSVIAIEYAIDQKNEEKAIANKTPKKNRPTSVVSPFESGWATAFGNTPRRDIVKQIDMYYTNNPDKLSRNVFEVIWYDLIKPKI